MGPQLAGSPGPWTIQEHNQHRITDHPSGLSRPPSIHYYLLSHDLPSPPIDHNITYHSNAGTGIILETNVVRQRPPNPGG